MACFTTRGTYASEITHLKNYVRDRSAWIDLQFVRPPVMDRAGGQVTAGTHIMLTATTNAIYYTLNGDRSAPAGGGIAPGALTYSGPITVNSNARIFARSHRPGHNLGPTTTARSPWSGGVARTFVVDTPKLEITEIIINPARHPRTCTRTRITNLSN